MSGALDLPPPFEAIVFDRLDSTNDHAKLLAGEGAAHGTIIWAREQTAGRGRQGRQWSSPPGNIYMSAILRPDVPANIATELGFVAAVAAADCLDACLPDGCSVALKWPNDLLADGAKIGGILLEAQSAESGNVDWVVVGIGLNVESHPDDAPYPVTSLAALGTAPAVGTVLALLVAKLAAWSETWRRFGFQPIRESWLGRGHGIGREILTGGMRGIFEGLDRDGALLLRLGGQICRITAGDVQFSAV